MRLRHALRVSIKIYTAVLLTVTAVLVLACAKDRATSGGLVVESVVGTVQLHGDAAGTVKNAVRDASPGDMPKPGQEIRTGERSLADMVYKKRGVVRIFEHTAVKTETVTDRADLFLRGGRMTVVLGRLEKDGRFRVTTPTMTVSVRGTGFRITVGSGRTRVEVIGGRVDISPAPGGVEVKDVVWSAGPGTYAELDENESKKAAESGGGPSPVRKLSDEAASEIRAELDDVHARVLDGLEPAAREEFVRTTGRGGSSPKTAGGKRSASNLGKEGDAGRAAREEEDRRARERDRAGGRP